MFRLYHFRFHRILAVASLGVALSACGLSGAERRPLPTVSPGGAWITLVGSGPRDLWVVQLDDAREAIFFHSTGGDFVSVPTPPALAGANNGISAVSGGDEDLLVTILRDDADQLVRLRADGSNEELDTSSFFPELTARAGVSFRALSDGEQLYVIAQAADLPPRLYRQEDGA